MSQDKWEAAIQVLKALGKEPTDAFLKVMEMEKEGKITKGEIKQTLSKIEKENL